MTYLVIREYDIVGSKDVPVSFQPSFQRVPREVYEWLEKQAIYMGSDNQDHDRKSAPWLRLISRGGEKVIQFLNFVGVVRAPCGFQIEILPKIALVDNVTDEEARSCLLRMLVCLKGFQHIHINSAQLAAVKMPLLDIFITEFLTEVSLLVHRGIHKDYIEREDNLSILRGKILMSHHIRNNISRADRFYTRHDEFSGDIPVNRIIHTALSRVSKFSKSSHNRKKIQQLLLAFEDIPFSHDFRNDFQKIVHKRGIKYYTSSLQWSRLILDYLSPLTSSGQHIATSLLFPMEKLFESYVAFKLSCSLSDAWKLQSQVGSKYLVTHKNRGMFRLIPDIVLSNSNGRKIILDTKWKLLNQNDRKNKYNLSQSDFYQLCCYGQVWLRDSGNLVLIYPATSDFYSSLSPFVFNTSSQSLNLHIVPFCLKKDKLLLHESSVLNDVFKS